MPKKPQSPLQKATLEYGQNLRMIRGAVANLQQVSLRLNLQENAFLKAYGKTLELHAKKKYLKSGGSA